MTASDLALLAFTTCNTLRVLAYVPQIIKIYSDIEGAKAISYSTWGLFAVANLSTAAYALATVHDMAMAAIFGGNALFCFTIVGLTAWKRAGLRKAASEGAATMPEPSAMWRRTATTNRRTEHSEGPA